MNEADLKFIVNQTKQNIKQLKGTDELYQLFAETDLIDLINCHIKPGKQQKARVLPLPIFVERAVIMAFKYTIKLSDPKAPDVTNREVSVVVNGADPKVETLEGIQVDYVFVVPEDSEVSLTVVDIDNKGNRSTPSVPLVFTASDTIPPPQPDTPVIEAVEEVA